MDAMDMSLDGEEDALVIGMEWSPLVMSILGEFSCSCYWAVVFCCLVSMAEDGRKGQGLKVSDAK
jgi:hypothetical protein